MSLPVPGFADQAEITPRPEQRQTNTTAGQIIITAKTEQEVAFLSFVKISGRNAKREIARINVGFPAGLLSPRRWRERAKLSSMKIVRRRFARSKKKGRNIQYSNGRATFFRPAIFFFFFLYREKRVPSSDCFRYLFFNPLIYDLPSK